MLEPSAADYGISGASKIDQRQTVIENFVVEAEFSVGGTKDPFLAHHGIEIAKHVFDIVTQAALKEDILEASFSSIGERAQMSQMLKNLT